MLATLVPVIITVITTIGTLVPILMKLNDTEKSATKRSKDRDKRIDALVAQYDQIKTSIDAKDAICKRCVKEINYNTLDIMRLTAWNEHIPIATRIAACIRYVNRGGNHETQELAMKLKAEYPDLWHSMELVVEKIERDFGVSCTEYA